MKEHISEVRVRWGDTDAAGIIYYPNIFHYFEGGIEEYLFRGLGFEAEGYYATLREVGFPRVAAKAEFLAPLKFDELLDVHVTVSRLGNTSITFAIELRKKKGGQVAARGEVTCVTIDRKSWRPMKVPEELARRIKG